MLLCLYQIFIFLLGHLHFFLHIFFAFMENLFKKHPIHFREIRQKQHKNRAIALFVPIQRALSEEGCAGNKIHLEFDVADFEPEDVEVKLSGGTLRVAGRRREKFEKNAQV